MFTREEAIIPVTGLTSPHFCPCPKPESGFQRNMLWFFLCSVVWSERWLFVLLILMKLFKFSFHNTTFRFNIFSSWYSCYQGTSATMVIFFYLNCHKLNIVSYTMYNVQDYSVLYINVTTGFYVVIFTHKWVRGHGI
jgi:hypothetical protein